MKEIVCSVCGQRVWLREGKLLSHTKPGNRDKRARMLCPGSGEPPVPTPGTGGGGGK